MSAPTKQPPKTYAQLHYKTGFCNIGCHEGLKPRSASGKPMRVCTMREICTCKCHKDLDEMYEMAGEPREEHQNSDWSPTVQTFQMPVYGVDYGVPLPAPSADPIDAPNPLQRPTTGAIGGRTFDPTPSGRAARGQLEAQVLEVCTEWAVDRAEVCTPSFVAWDVGRFNSIPEPSTGAVAAVFYRWRDYGFAIIKEKPLRFSGFTEDGLAKGLDHMKGLYKYNKRKES